MVYLEKKDIIVIGGYGHVGKLICKQLADYYPGNVYAAGRSQEKAERFAASTNGEVKAMVLDINQAVPANILATAKLVIVCLEQENVAFAASCLESGIDYIDISASYTFLQKVEELHQSVVQSNGAALLSVGLNPGVTNLLAKWVADKMDTTDSIDIFLMLGLGDTHGHAAIEWTIQQVKTDFHKWENGRRILKKSFVGKETAYFGKKLGFRKAYPFNFADQHVLPKTINVDPVSTFLCFDSRLATGSFSIMKRLGLIRFLPDKWTTNMFKRVSIGEPMFHVKIRGKGIKAGKEVVLETDLSGQEEAKITAYVTTWAAKYMYEFNNRKGVFHLEEIADWTSVYEAIKPDIVWEISSD
ncbi:saccharopine dehydrogenase [Niallia circulans]|uniref:Saccharopine dehydrogenase n=1 Tax=Niallia circulans TaxID=1397 RepID=A0A553SS55_NIACI|nr:saccharopine dehydrogenase [Niallia circulans]